MMSYIAQCQFARSSNTEIGNRLEITDHLGNSIPERDDVFRYGWNIAGILLAGGKPSPADYQLLYTAVAKHPYYSEEYLSQTDNDGI